MFNLGTEDFVKRARNQLQAQQASAAESTSSQFNNISLNESYSLSDSEQELTNQISETSKESSSEYELPIGQSIDPLYDDIYKDNIDVFVPTTKVQSEKDQLIREELEYSTFEPRDIHVRIEQPEFLNINKNIEAFVFPKGDVTEFPPSKSYNNRCSGYYLMDAASVMPVLALDVQPDDDVLDMCAAPGGKAMLILQCLDSDSGGSLLCNDSSLSRLNRLRNVLTTYYPEDVYRSVTVWNRQGGQIHSCLFDKVP